MSRTASQHRLQHPFFWKALATVLLFAGLLPLFPERGWAQGSPGFVVSPRELETYEGGDPVTFQVVLTSMPAADVSFEMECYGNGIPPRRATISPTSLTFSPDNWDVPQTVTVTPIDDQIKEWETWSDILIYPATSGDPAYDGLDPDDVVVIHYDDDQAGLYVSSSGTTTEAGGQGTIEFQLTSRPLAGLTMTLESSNPAEGTVFPTELYIIPDDWDQPHTVTVTGVDDLADDGDAQYTIIISYIQSNDEYYEGIDPEDQVFTNLDDEGAGVLVTPVLGLTTAETGTKAQFKIVLTQQPTANVKIPLSSGDPTEATVTPAILTITPDNWSKPKTIVVTGLDDEIADGDVVFEIVTGPAISADPAYQGFNAANVQVTNQDDDQIAVGDFYTMEPCRMMDTRLQGYGPALASGEVRIWSPGGMCGLPATAVALVANVTVTEATGAGEIVLFPGDLSAPATSTVSFVAGQTRANNAILPLATDDSGTLAARALISGTGGTVHVIVDLIGYFD